VQAADLIGQLGDPAYPRKANALYWEFEEVGINRQLGYASPADVIEKYPSFFWNSVSMYLQEGLKFLNLTHSGCRWIANLHNHLLCAEHGQRLMGLRVDCGDLAMRYDQRCCRRRDSHGRVDLGSIAIRICLFATKNA